MEKLLDFVGLFRHQRIRGVDSQELYKNSLYLNEFKLANDIKLNFEKQKNITLEGAQHRTGNRLSFLFLFKELASISSNQSFLILEDDIDLRADFANILTKSLQFAPADWEVLLCGYTHHKSNKNKIIPQPSRRFWLPTEFFFCLHCFVIRNSSIAALIANKLDEAFFTIATDYFIYNLIKSHNLIVYAAKKQMAVQRRDIFSSNTKNPGYIPEIKLSNSAIDLMNRLKY